jgi:hypothetical protein
MSATREVLPLEEEITDAKGVQPVQSNDNILRGTKKKSKLTSCLKK